MVDVIPAPAHHVLAVRASGKIDADDIRTVTGELDRRLSAHEKVSLYIEVGPLSGFTFEALLRDVEYGLKNLKNLGRFQRVAVVSGANWVRRISDWENRLLPRVEIRGFASGATEEAMAWVAGPGPHLPSPGRLA